MDKVIRFLTKDVRDGNIDLHFGWIDKITLGGLFHDKDGNSKIVFNICLMIVDTFVHEMYHFHLPHLSEKEVIRRTQSLMNRMTVKQIKELFTFVMVEGGEI